MDCTTGEFHEELCTSFPQLRNADGFQLLRCLPSTRDLEVIPPPILLSPRLLTIRISTSKVFIQPIKRNLEVEVDLSEEIRNVYIIQYTIDNLRSLFEVPRKSRNTYSSSRLSMKKVSNLCLYAYIDCWSNYVVCIA